jgi:hypothetical protein
MPAGSGIQSKPSHAGQRGAVGLEHGAPLQHPLRQHRNWPRPMPASTLLMR